MSELAFTAPSQAMSRRAAALLVAAAVAMLGLAFGAPPAGAAGFELLVSTTPDRAGASLADRTVTGSIYVFVAPEAGATMVRFYLDDPLRQRAPHRTEKGAPWDFGGSAGDGTPIPLDTTSLVDGIHTITAAVARSTGGTEVITSSFNVSNGAPALMASPASLSFAVDQGGAAAAQTIDVSMSDGSTAFVSASDDAAWMTVSPAMGTTSDALSVAIDAAGLASGTYAATITITSPGLTVLAIPVTLQVRGGAPPPPEPGAWTLLSSASPTRSSPAELAGQTVTGAIHVFVAPDSGIKRVRFYLDDPGMTRSPRKTENGTPYDFAGSASGGGAIPFDTATIPDGSHTITAAIERSTGGTEVISSSFLVANQGPALVASPAALSFAVEPGGAAAAETLQLSMSDGSAASFTVSDNAPWLAVTPTAGTTPRALSVSVSASALGTGTHAGTVTVTRASGDSVAIPVTLQVQGSLQPDQVHLAWTDDPSTTLTVLWRTWQTSTPHTVQYRVAGQTAWQTASGAARPSGTAGTLHEVTLEQLTPSTAYEYRVRGDGSAWSEVFTARTAPPRGPADFDAVYVADTGLVGRLDGLATGTQQVVDEIAALNPDLVLLGGDYAYYNTDQRYGTLDNTIDTWFNQMQPIGARSPMMVSYGNHETLLSERFEDWAPRFATPDGWNGRRAYSFDVGDVHFVSIFAVSDTTGLPSGQLDWIEQDIVAAKAAGARWVVPFFHVSPFADGKNHPSNVQLRGQLGPLFERLGVKIALASHDQAYERSYPLVGVPSAIASTSTSKRCYTAGDGVTWVKISPGGKLSNKNGTFSAFATNPAPLWTAFRDNTAHHFSRLLASAQGSLRLETYAVVGDGSPPVVVDSFEYRLGGCPPELALNKHELTFNTTHRGSAPAGQSLAVAGASGTTYTVSDDAPWLTVTPDAGSTPGSLHVTANPSGLAPGRHIATITVSAAGTIPATAIVVLNVHGVVMSASPDRSAPIPLDGRTVAGRIYVFTLPHEGATRVRFWLDDPTMSGAPRKVESNAPWDFAGSASDGTALPFDTSRLSSGTHTITAAIDIPGGSAVVSHAQFDR
jgi:hypothetical protein